MAEAKVLDREDTIWEFGRVVNMAPAAMERWLETEDSKAVGWRHEGEEEAVGHQSAAASSNSSARKRRT
jgi:hypothetical protein